MIDLTNQEYGVLLATRVSDNALTLPELAQICETRLENAHKIIAGLVNKGILEPIESYDEKIVYGYAENEQAQQVYEEIHRRR